MTKEEHIKRHEDLHKSFDELFADFILHAGGRTTSTIFELIDWSHAQTIDPDHEDD